MVHWRVVVSDQKFDPTPTSTAFVEAKQLTVTYVCWNLNKRNTE